MTSTPIFMGIDIAKADFVVACRPAGTSWTARNAAAGIAATVDRLRALAPSLIVLEATGGYETALVVALAAAALPVVVANPRQVHDFGKATGQLAKTDRLDAQLLALFAERVQPAPRPVPDAALHWMGSAPASAASRNGTRPVSISMACSTTVSGSPCRPCRVG